MAVRDADRDIVVGRDGDMARVREAVLSRREQSQSLLITGPAGIGKSALVEAVLPEISHAEILYLRGTPLDGHGPFETALNNIATFEQSERFEPIKTEIAEVVAWAYKTRPPGRDVARALVQVMRSIPPQDRPVVVVFENLQLFDSFSLQATALFARQNHLYDQPYLILGRSPHTYPDLDGLPHIRLGPLDVEACRQALTHWSQVLVPAVVASSLAASCDGNPLILREVAASLTLAQLRGDARLPAPLPSTPVIDECLSPWLTGLSPAELRTVAAFCLSPSLPLSVARSALPENETASLLERGLLVLRDAELWIEPAALGWVGWHQLSLQDRSHTARDLAEATPFVDVLTAARYRGLQTPPPEGVVVGGREALRGARGDEPALLREAVAELSLRNSSSLTAPDGLRWIAACLDAGHLGAAVEAWPRVTTATHDGDDVLALARAREVLGGLTGNPVLGLATPAEIEEFGSLSPADAFSAWVLAARGAVRAGAIQQGRRYLDLARNLSRSAALPGRSLWRLVDCEWHVGAGRPVPSEVYLEAVTRWCDHDGGMHWYDDTVAVELLTDLGESAMARQFLTSIEAVHNRAVGIVRTCLLGARLHVELAESRIPAARHVADELSRHTLSLLLDAPTLRGNLLRLHALSGWSGAAYEAARQTPDTGAARPITAALGLQELLDGQTVAAVHLLRAALIADRAVPIDQWELLADLVEAHVAAGDRRSGSAVLEAAGLPEPRSAASAAAAARAHALVAQSFAVRTAFARALTLSGPPLPSVYRARTLLAYARRLASLGASDEAQGLQAEASGLFVQQGFSGWHRHATMLALPDSTAAPSLGGGPPNVAEQDLLRLVMEGVRNKAIADELYLSLRTVEKMLTKLYRDYGVSSKAGLVAKLTDS